jgi:hypothetical protein
VGVRVICRRGGGGFLLLYMYPFYVYFQSGPSTTPSTTRLPDASVSVIVRDYRLRPSRRSLIPPPPFFFYLSVVCGKLTEISCIWMHKASVGSNFPPVFLTRPCCKSVADLLGLV